MPSGGSRGLLHHIHMYHHGPSQRAVKGPERAAGTQARQWKFRQRLSERCHAGAIANGKPDRVRQDIFGQMRQPPHCRCQIIVKPFSKRKGIMS
jgi:hypothetical protein